MGFVIGKKASYVSESEALEYVLGFFLVNDVSEREFQKNKGLTWDKGKGFDTFGPIGPFILTKDELPDYQKLNMYLDVNGKRMQKGNTEHMIFNVKKLVSYMSHCMTLEPGDICCTGTPPGVGENMKPAQFLKEGDIVKLGMDNLGEQSHKVISFKYNLNSSIAFIISTPALTALKFCCLDSFNPKIANIASPI